MDITVIEYNSDIPIPYGNIAIYNGWKLESAFETDDNGIAKIDLASYEKAFEIQLSHVGFEKYMFRTSKNGSYDIKIHLHPKALSRKVGHTEEYKLLELSDSIFSYSPFHDSLQIIKLYNK